MTEIATLTLNPSIDLSTQLERVQPIHKLRCRGLQRDPGGGGINVARVVKRLGLEVTAVYAAGGSIGQLLQDLVAQEGVDSLVIRIAAETRENLTVDERASGEQFRFLLPGPEVREEEWRDCLNALATMAPFPRYVVASGSLPPGAPDDLYARVACVAKQHRAKLVLDTSGEALRTALEEGVYLVKPNLNELADLLGARPRSEADCVKAARRLLERRQAEVVALTLGDRGAFLATGEGVWRAPGLDIRPVSTIGAGDSFLGGLLWSLVSGRSMQEALCYAMAAGSAALLAPGTALSEPDDIERLRHEVEVRRIA